MTPYLTHLRDVPGLECCSRRELDAIAKVAERVSVPAGRPLLEPADHWTGMCTITDGEAIAQTPAWSLLMAPGSRLVRRGEEADALRVVARTDLVALAFPRRQRVIIDLALNARRP